MITVDLTSATPPFEQVRERLREQIESGELAAGTKLPPVRRQADELGLATNTVARAYRELEVLGLIETRGRAGSVVAGGGVEQASRQAAHDYAVRARELGLDLQAALELLRRTWG